MHSSDKFQAGVAVEQQERSHKFQAQTVAEQQEARALANFKQKLRQSNNCRKCEAQTEAEEQESTVLFNSFKLVARQPSTCSDLTLTEQV